MQQIHTIEIDCEIPTDSTDGVFTVKNTETGRSASVRISGLKGSSYICSMLYSNVIPLVVRNIASSRPSRSAGASNTGAAKPTPQDSSPADF